MNGTSSNGVMGEWADLSFEGIEGWMVYCSGTLKNDEVTLDLDKVTSPEVLVGHKTTTERYEVWNGSFEIFPNTVKAVEYDQMGS